MEFVVTGSTSTDGIDVIRVSVSRVNIVLEKEVQKFSNWQTTSLKKSPLESIDIHYKPLKDILKCKDFSKEFIKEAYRKFRESYKQADAHIEDDAFALYLFNFNSNGNEKGKEVAEVINKALSRYDIKKLEEVSFYVMHVLHSLKNSPLEAKDETFYRAFYAEDIDLKQYTKGKEFRWQEFSRVFKTEEEAISSLNKGTTENKKIVIVKIQGEKLVHDVSAFSYGSNDKGK